MHKILAKCTAQCLLPIIHSTDRDCQPVHLALNPQQEQTFRLKTAQRNLQAFGYKAGEVQL